MDAIDKILATEEELVASSGFLASVMDRVKDEAAVQAAAPPPIPFPWKRFIPGLVIAVAVLGWAAFELIRSLAHTAITITLPQVDLAAPVSRSLQQAAWIALAAILSIASWLFSRRLGGRSGML